MNMLAFKKRDGGTTTSISSKGEKRVCMDNEGNVLPIRACIGKAIQNRIGKLVVIQEERVSGLPIVVVLGKKNK